jgi:RND family efflux transporter MFP subunit
VPAKLRTRHILISIPVVIVAALLGFRFYQAAKSEPEQGPGGGRGEPRAITVETGIVYRGMISETISLVGSLRAKEQVDVSPKIQGRIVQIGVDTGQAVARGALLASIDGAEIQEQIERSKATIAVNDASISQREAELNNAKAELDRTRSLVDAGLLSRQEMEAVQTRHRVAESQLELARAQKRQAEAELRELTIRHGQTRIEAPLSGVIAKRHVDVGAMVNTSTPVVTLVNVRTMVIHANTPESQIARVKPGTAATVLVDGLGGRQYSGRVMRISPVLDPQTRTGAVEIEIDNSDGSLKAEMFARAQLDLGTTREALLLPRDGLIYRGDQPGVYVIDSNVARFKRVETGLTQGNGVEAIRGMQEGETVITRGANLVKDGDSVRVAGNSDPRP